MSKSKAKPKPKKKKKRKPRQRRADYQLHDELIELKYAELMLKKQKPPTYQDIADAIGCDVSTIKRHVADMDFDERFSKWRLATPMVIQNLFKQAATSKNDAFVKLWLDKIEGLGKTKVEITGKDGHPLFKVYKGIDPDKV